MKVIGQGSLFFIVLSLLSLACNPSSTNKMVTTPAFDPDEIQQDIKTGRIKFEVRGLTNEAQEKSYGGKTFEHRAMVVPVGDPKYLKGNYLLVCSVKRVSGGDPENTRKADDITMVYVHDGIGRFVDSGGYKVKDEKWEPEKIEVRPSVVFVGIPTDGTAAQD